MILYCDTSALLKLYVTEAGSEVVRQKMDEADVLAVCRVTWAEAHAAFARRVREAPQDSDAIARAKSALAYDWPRFVVVGVDQSLVESAGDYADTFALRGFDSIQLAAAARIQQVTETAALFACFDNRLNKAAKILGLEVLN